MGLFGDLIKGLVETGLSLNLNGDDYICPDCGATMDYDGYDDEWTCPSCGNVVFVEDDGSVTLNRKSEDDYDGIWHDSDDRPVCCKACDGDGYPDCMDGCSLINS